MTDISIIPVLCDIAIVALLILSYSLGAKRGLSKYLYKACASAGSIILAIALAQSVSSYLAGTDFADTIYNKVYASVEQKVMESDIMQNISGTSSIDDASIKRLSGEFNLPKMLVSSVLKSAGNTAGTIEGIIENSSRSITMIILKIITLVFLFILIRFLFFLLFRVLDGASKLPVLKSINRFAGGILGLIQMLLFIYILAAALTLLSTGEQSAVIHGIINKTYIVKYFYNYNIIIQLLIRL